MQPGKSKALFTAAVAVVLLAVVLVYATKQGLGPSNPLSREAQAQPLPPQIRAEASMNFVRTDSSSEWVKRTFVVQERYRRVLGVSPDGTAPPTIRVASLNFEGPEDAQAIEYPVAAVFQTIQQAADASHGGDLVAVMPGTYAGFSLGDKPDAADGNYIHFRAMGRPGQVVINRPAEQRTMGGMIYLVGDVHHVILQGFNIDGSRTPRRGRGSIGILIQGLFYKDGKWAHHIIVADVFSHDHDRWGLHSVNSHTVLIQDCCFTGMTGEHGAYVSDGSRNYVIRRNVFQGNVECGLQCNIDPSSTLHGLARHPDLASYPRYKPTRDWAVGLIAMAAEKFGKDGFPDGRGRNFIIENNVMTGNGRDGGGALNLAALQDSLIQNNLIYNNANHGIAEWDSAVPWDQPYVAAPPATPEQARNTQILPLWGGRGNRVRNNTVLMSNPTRFALGLLNGSWENRVHNNVFINDQGASMEVTSTSILDLDSGYNVMGDVWFTSISANSWPVPGLPGGPMPESLKSLAKNIDAKDHSTLGVNSARIAGEFVRYGQEPWVLLENGWWRLNPARPDFHPKAGSTLLSGRGDPTELPTLDLDGEPRQAADVGALRTVKP